MPKFTDTSGALQKHNTGQFGFSAVRIDDLLATEYTLVTLAVDRSGSTSGWQQQMEDALKRIVEGCLFNIRSDGTKVPAPRADNLIFRLVNFDDKAVEVVGWELMSNFDVSRFDGTLTPGGATALYDACINGLEGMSNFGRTLLDSDYSVNGIFVCITDGEENHSKMRHASDPAKYVRDAMQQCVKGENMESLLSILVALNAGQQTHALKSFQTDVGFTEYVDIGDADAKKINKLIGYISSSISSQSQALGSGGVSKTLPPPI